MNNRIISCWLSFAVVMLIGFNAAAMESSSAQSSYRIGPNDVIRIQVFGEEDLTVESKVGGDGELNYPLLGVLQVGGHTTEDLQQDLTKRLAAGYVRLPKVSVSIVRHRNFYVSGEVKVPGGFPFEDGITAQKAISMAGGFTDKAAQGSLTITRRTANLENTVSAQLHTPLLPDDTLVVGQLQKFFMMGEVSRPGPYPYEDMLTANKAISLGGGFTEKADKQGLKVTRVTDAGAQTLQLSLDDLILPNDILAVATQNHKFYISGEVRNPGAYPYVENISIQKALTLAGGVTEKAERGTFQVLRKVNGHDETVAMGLDRLVQLEDLIVVAEVQRVFVSGEVKAPGRYLYEKGMTVRKAISMAGGWTEKADRGIIKVTRVTDGVAQPIDIALDAPALPDDFIVVPQGRRFYVNGEVKKPGDFVYERGLTLHMAITMAGGFTEKASKKPKVLRSVNGKEQSFEFSLDAPILPDDIIVVSQRFF